MINMMSFQYLLIIWMIGMISGLLLLQIFHLILDRIKLKFSVQGLSKKDVGMIFLLLGVLVLYISNFHVMMDENHLSAFRKGLTLLVVITPIYGIFYILNQKEHIRNLEAREKERDLLFEEERISYQKMNERNEEIRMFKHDIDDELDYLYRLALNNDLNEVLAHIEKMKGATGKTVKSIVQYTGSTATNASWYALISNKKYMNVQHEWLGKFPPNMMIDNRDIVRLLSNLLKNAFEAAVQSKDEKYVKVRIIADQNRVLIMIRNSYMNEIKASYDGTLKTTKLKKEKHGIGTRIIEDIVMAYGGKIKYDYDGIEFVTRVVFGADILKNDTRCAYNH